MARLDREAIKRSAISASPGGQDRSGDGGEQAIPLVLGLLLLLMSGWRWRRYTLAPLAQFRDPGLEYLEFFHLLFFFFFFFFFLLPLRSHPFRIKTPRSMLRGSVGVLLRLVGSRGGRTVRTRHSARASTAALRCDARSRDGGRPTDNRGRISLGQLSLCGLASVTLSSREGKGRGGEDLYYLSFLA